MAWTPTATTRGCMKCTEGTLDGSDDNFTFDTNVVRFWLSIPAHSVKMYPASASSGKQGFTFLPISTVFGPFNGMSMGGKVVTFVGTSADVLQIMEELNTGVTT